jgi:hypothetical protein
LLTTTHVPAECEIVERDTGDRRTGTGGLKAYANLASLVPVNLAAFAL